MTYRAVIYARVSSDRQREQHTIGSQLRLLPEHVAREGWTLVETCTDDGKSGETTDGRPGFLRVLDLADARAFDVLVVIDLDRITRAKNSAQGALIYDQLRECKIKIAVPGQALVDLENEDQDFFVALRREIAKWEKRKMLARTARGRAEAARLGRRFSSRDPVGYRWEPDASLAARGRYVIVPDEAIIVKRMVALALEGKGTTLIQWTINKEGHRTRRGGPWRTSTIRKILRQTTIKGEFRVLSQKTTIKVPAIIDAETWARVQLALDGRKMITMRPGPGKYLLSGIAKCGVCGAAMWVTTQRPNQRYAYYRCSTTNEWRRMHRTGPCGQKHHRQDMIDANVWERAQDVLSDPQLLAEACSLAASEETTGVDWRSQREQCRRRMSEIDVLQGEVLARRRRGLVTAEACDRELDVLARELRIVERSMQLAEEQLAGSAAQVARLNDLARCGARLAAKMRTADLAMQREILILLVGPPRGSVTIHLDGSVVVIGTAPLQAGDRELVFSVPASAKSA